MEEKQLHPSLLCIKQCAEINQVPCPQEIFSVESKKEQQIHRVGTVLTEA